MKTRLLALALLASGCMDFGGHDDKVELDTHVEDWRDEVIYQVMVDRFADGDSGNNYNVLLSDLARYQGGDWQGLEDRLDYLELLGVTTLWISPVVKNVDTDANVDGYHGYWAQDFDGDQPSLRRHRRRCGASWPRAHDREHPRHHRRRHQTTSGSCLLSTTST